VQAMQCISNFIVHQYSTTQFEVIHKPMSHNPRATLFPSKIVLLSDLVCSRDRRDFFFFVGGGTWRGLKQQ
jgi:hypothetical protein